MKYIFALLLLIPFLSQAEELDRVLSPEDYSIYLHTFNKCHKGTIGAAFRTTIDPEIMKSAAINLSEIMTLNLAASKARMDAHGLSPELARLTHSDGFWIAFRDCYAGSSEAKIILIKNIIDLGHITSEVTGTVASLYFAGKLAAFRLEMLNVHPIASRLAFSSLISIAIAKKFNFIKDEYFKKPTPQEAEMIQKAELDMFKDVNTTMRNLLALAELKRKSLDMQLEDKNLNSTERQNLLNQRDKLQQEIQALRPNLPAAVSTTYKPTNDEGLKSFKAISK